MVSGSTGCNGGVRSRLLLCGVIGPVIFVASFLIQGALRSGYDALRHPVSSLSLGPAGWVQMVTFWLAGLLIAAYAVGLRRAGSGWWTPGLVGLVGVGLVGAGIFAADPISGLPARFAGVGPTQRPRHRASTVLDPGLHRSAGGHAGHDPTVLPIRRAWMGLVLPAQRAPLLRLLRALQLRVQPKPRTDAGRWALAAPRPRRRSQLASRPGTPSSARTVTCSSTAVTAWVTNPKWPQPGRVGYQAAGSRVMR
jgi:hypothetical protein